MQQPRANMSTEAIASTLESDLRTLSSEARRADGLASQLTGWLSGPEHPQIKEAAERAILRLRSFGAREDGLEHLRNSKVHSCSVEAISTVSSLLSGQISVGGAPSHRMSYDPLSWPLSPKAPSSYACHWSACKSWWQLMPLLLKAC